MWREYRRLVDVAEDIAQAWTAAEHRYEAFADIVWERTGNLDLLPFGDLANVPALLESPEIAALQRPSTFSDLYFKLYDNGRFWVEVLNWWGSDINVHDHDFAAVQFQLRGRSLNAVYRFDREAVADHLAIGTLSVAHAELWQENSRSIVRPGAAEPHNVRHLDVPTVSLLIRTHPDPSYGPQNNYLAPLIAGDYGVADTVFRKKMGSLRLLGQHGQPEFCRAFERTVAGHTHAQNLFTVVKLIDLLFLPDYRHLLEAYGLKGEIEAGIVQAAAVHRAQEFLDNTIKFIPQLTETERLATAVLSSAFSRSSLDTLVGSLAARGTHLDLDDAVHVISSKLDHSLRRQFRAALNTLDLAAAPAFKAA